MPFSYFSMTATPTDGQAHIINMYSDISGEWLSGDPGSIMSWTTTGVDNNYIILAAQLQNAQPFQEIADHAQDGTSYYAMKASQPGAQVTWQLSGHIDTRTAFANATLSSAADPASAFRAINNNFPVLAIAVSLGSIPAGTTSLEAVWTLGLVRDPAVQYMNPSGLVEKRHPYFLSAFSDQLTAVRFVIDDYTNALSSAIALDAQILAAGLRYSQEYADLLTLATRQALAALDVTLVQNSDGSWNGTDIKAFMKNMGSVGATSGVNAVDVMYAAFPVYMYLNPELGGYLLKPLLEYQDSSLYQLPYAAQNIGSAYPNATGDGLNQQHQFGIEESANMLLMTLAHAQASGNGTLISRHYTLLKKWADYLVSTALTPNNQLSPDKLTLASSNMTNVALKGILGIAAMGKINKYAGVKDDTYANTASSYINQWATLATASDNSHLLMTYGSQSSSGLVYNLYYDQLLQLNLVPQQIYDIQTVFLNNEAPQSSFGLPLDNTDSTSTRSDWMLFSAAAVTHSTTRDFMVKQVHNTVLANQTNHPFCAAYDPTSAGCKGGQNSPAQGAMFALLALNGTIKSSISLPLDGSTIPGLGASKKSNGGAIAGGVIGALAVVALAGAAFFFYRRRKQRIHDPEFFHSDKINSGKPPGFGSNQQFEPLPYGSEVGNTSHAGGVTSADSLRYSASGGPGGAYTLSYNDTANAGNAHQYQPVSPTEMTHSVYVGGPEARNVRDSAYFRTRGQSVSESDIGPSASQVGAPSAVSSSSQPLPPLPPGAADPTPQVILAKQTLLNEELRSEVDNLRRDLERIRYAHLPEEAPPSYEEPHV